MLTKTHSFQLFVLLLLLAIGLAACAPGTPNADATAIADSFIRTQAAASVKMTLTAAVAHLQVTPTVPAPDTLPTESPTSLPAELPTLTPIPSTDTPQPSPTQTPEPQVNCTDKASFVSETVPDNAQFTPGQLFTKTWVLKNTGTCTWTTAYSFSFSKGEQMGAQQNVALPQAVLPQAEITISANLTAPSQAGTYQADFLLKNASGASFGVGRNANLMVWVLIKVVETDTDLNLGVPTWTDKFDVASGLWPLFKDAQTNYEIKNGELVISALVTSGDLWRVVAYPAVSNQYVQAVFKTGEDCTGTNSYGLAIRSYAQGDSVYDSGYILSVSCDGKYRIYSLDNGSFTNVKNWTASEAILKGNNQTNKVGIMAKGNQFTVYINGVKVATFTDSIHTQGQFGLVIRAGETAPFVVTIEEFSYWELE